SIATGISMLVFLIVTLGLLTGAVFIFISQISWLGERIPVYGNILQKEILTQSDFLKERFDALPADLSADIIDKAKDFSATLAKKGTSFIGWLLGAIVGMVGSVSTFVFNIVLAVILAYFLSVEIDTWKRF